MGLFDFVGTFFFLSLGITFVLILLLVYHFKQRLTEMEQKSDKMFEIVNTIVKEMGNMRRAISQYAQEPQVSMTPQYRSAKEHYSEEHADDDEDSFTEYEEVPPNTPETHTIVYNIGDASRAMNDFFHISTRTQEDDDEELVVVENDSQPQVKVVSVDLTYNEDDVNTDDELTSLGDFEPDDTPVVEVSPNREEIIHVNKLDEMMPPVEDVEHEVTHAEQHQIPYNKMNLTQLRTYAVSRGLLSDSSKMKKAELIKLLESND